MSLNKELDKLEDLGLNYRVKRLEVIVEQLCKGIREGFKFIEDSGWLKEIADKTKNTQINIDITKEDYKYFNKRIQDILDIASDLPEEEQLNYVNKETEFLTNQKFSGIKFEILPKKTDNGIFLKIKISEGTISVDGKPLTHDFIFEVEVHPQN